MDFRIAETFVDSMGRLTGDEQKAVKTTAFDLQLDPQNPGHRFHKLDKARDKSFWSVRVNSDLRLIVHKTQQSLLLCYVAHHDKAYEWAERRKLQVHPTTGAAQIVEVRETVQEIVVPRYVDAAPQAPSRKEPAKKAPAPQRPLFTDITDDVLLSHGVPPEWLPDVRAATEDSLLTLAGHLPEEAAEALLEYAVGGVPREPPKAAPATASVAMALAGGPTGYIAARLLRLFPADPDRGNLPHAPTAAAFDHPDAQRRFRVMANAEDLERALEYHWERWMVFLHPDQRDWVERDYSGPARVSGSAGTGKTIVALHRAVRLARANPDGRVLLTTFSDTLANALRTRLKRLLSNEPRLGERIDVHGLQAIGRRLFKLHVGHEPTVVSRADLCDIVRDAAASVDGHKYSVPFLVAEWEHVVDPWQLDSWESYRDVARLGRKTRLSEGQRKTLWAIFDRVRGTLAAKGLSTEAQIFTQLATKIGASKNPPFDFAVVDEAQDLGVAHLRFLAALAGQRANALFFAGDLGQRIFQQPFSWKTLGVDVRGRSRTLRVNYRTSHQIRRQADRLLESDLTDVDGIEEKRSDTISVFNGPPPTLLLEESVESEARAVGTWLAERIHEDGLLPHEIGVFVRSEAELPRALAALVHAGLKAKVLDEHVDTASGSASVGTMHLAKGLEFRAVAVMACDDEVIPLQQRIEAVGDDADLQEVYDTERQLLYVACTRARDHLLVSGVEPASEFLDDMAS